MRQQRCDNQKDCDPVFLHRSLWLSRAQICDRILRSNLKKGVVTALSNYVHAYVCVCVVASCPGKSHPWTNTSLRETLWTNGPQISLKVLVYTGIGPYSALLCMPKSQTLKGHRMVRVLVSGSFSSPGAYGCQFCPAGTTSGEGEGLTL